MASLNLQKVTTNELLYIGFNQDFGCFAVGTDKGFRIYNCEPFRETFKRDFASGGVGIVEMLFRCNILALVGGGATPKFPPHKVMIWDDHQNRCIGELSFRSDVKAVRLRRDRVVVALNTKVYVYNFADLTLLDHVDTVENPRGLCVLCTHPSNNVLACPGMSKGHVRVELYDHRKTTLIAAHEASLACIALNSTGTRLATASEKGTLIRVYDTMTGDLLQELRRGADKAEIFCLAFNHNSSMLACTSDKGTVHIFKLNDAVQESITPLPSTTTSTASAMTATGSQATTPVPVDATPAGAGAQTMIASPAGVDESVPATDTNPKSSFSFMKTILPKYFSSEWSFAQYRVPETRCIVAFGQEPNTVIVVGADGSFFKANYEKGGDAIRVAYSHFAISGSWSLE